MADTVPVTKNGVFTIGDYGTNDSYASMPLFCSMIRHLRRKHGEDLPIQLLYEDQETNDYNSLFRRLSDPESPMSQFHNVFPLVSHRNFYRQCVPHGSCDVVFASFTTHWLEKLEMNFKDCVFHTLATEEERGLFRVEAEWDWIKFLTLRARELKPGGLLVVFSLGMETDEGKSTTPADDARKTNSADRKIKYGSTHLEDLHIDLDVAWKQLREEGIITMEEYQLCVIQEAFRTPEEITSPFESVTSPVRQAGLFLVHHDQVEQPCVYKSLWREKRMKEGVDDRNYFATILVAAHKIWNYSSFRGSLSVMRSEDEKDAIMDELYKRFHSRVMSKDPESYRSDVFLSRLVARKNVNG